MSRTIERLQKSPTISGELTSEQAEILEMFPLRSTQAE